MKEKPRRFKGTYARSNDPMLQSLTAEQARDGLATGTITPAQICQAMNHRMALANDEPDDVIGTEQSNLRIAGDLAVLAAPFYHDVVPPITAHTVPGGTTLTHSH